MYWKAYWNDDGSYKQIILLTGLAFMSSLMPSCFRTDEQMPKPTSPMPSPNSQVINGSETSGTKVSLVRTSDRKEGVQRAIALLQSNPIEGKSMTRVFSASAAPRRLRKVYLLFR